MPAIIPGAPPAYGTFRMITDLLPTGSTAEASAACELDGIVPVDSGPNARLSVAWSPDGQRALSGAADRTLRLWEVETGRCLRVLEGHTDRIWSVAWSPDGRRASLEPLTEDCGCGRWRRAAACGCSKATQTGSGA